MREKYETFSEWPETQNKNKNSQELTSAVISWPNKLFVTLTCYYYYVINICYIDMCWIKIPFPVWKGRQHLGTYENTFFICLTRRGHIVLLLQL